MCWSLWEPEISGRWGRSLSREKVLKGLLEAVCPGRVETGKPLAPLTSLKIGGPAEWFVTVDGEKELKALLPLLAGQEIPWKVLGKGSNLLISDRGIRGVVLNLKESQEPEKVSVLKNDRILLEVGAGMPLAGLVRWGIKNGVTGLEFLAGIPGSLGGAWAMNAGSYGREIKDLTVYLKMISPAGKVIKRGKKELSFDYRSLTLPPGEIILAGGLSLSLGDPEAIRKQTGKLWSKRRVNQPLKEPSCGSVFKNPTGDFAGRLIEKAGLKGVQKGGAQISSRHANFIVNLGQARAGDVLYLMNLSRERVWKKFGILLEPEVHLWGLDLRPLN
jgi:UDP-N-acetylmuramate dehydrogenase